MLKVLCVLQVGLHCYTITRIQDTGMSFFLSFILKAIKKLELIELFFKIKNFTFFPFFFT